MKIVKIEKIENVFHVTLTPNWLQLLFGMKQEVRKFKDAGRTFTFGGGTVYYNSAGEALENGDWIGEAIDKWRRSF